MLIREVILENFMSHKYSRIQLGPGVNVICGPNGAGKSSILVGISLALGQSHTERSRRLRDLVRWGEEFARITLVLDNSPRDGRRPIPRIKRDYVVLTRVLRADGRYWFEIDGVAATKEQVTRLLGKLGIDPDNMLIIMHQGMVERFVALDPRERLLLMEEAAGLREFRLNVIKARRKLEKALSEEKAVRELLDSARQTLEYWREQYERYQEKKELLMKKAFLERELAWSHALRWEEEVSSLRRAREAISEELASIGSEIEELGSREGELRGKLSALRAEARSKVNEAVEQERLASKAGILLKLASGMGGQLSSTLVELCRSELGLDVGGSELQVALARLAEEAQEKADRALGRALELEAELADLFERLMNILVRLEVLKFKREQLLAEL
ncbi:MAG TPA: hypothetical protein ENF78_01285, partial [Candidatus Bathyarchaeota archaeon]|nr:hypothetical protein [Candidatus Bathyarchaeota archaeon]